MPELTQRPIPTIRWRIGENEWTIVHEFYHSMRTTLCGQHVDSYNYRIGDTGIERNPGPVECRDCTAAHGRLAATEHAHWTLEYNKELSDSFGTLTLNSLDGQLLVEFYLDGSGVHIRGSGHMSVPSIDDFIAALQSARAVAAERLGEDFPSFGTLTELGAAPIDKEALKCAQ